MNCGVVFLMLTHTSFLKKHTCSKCNSGLSKEEAALNESNLTLVKCGISRGKKGTEISQLPGILSKSNKIQETLISKVGVRSFLFAGCPVSLNTV